MKSPVYGLGRNRKHKPRGSTNHPSAANVNMRGKKTKSMSCCCCICIDKREQIVYKEYIKQIGYNNDET